MLALSLPATGGPHASAGAWRQSSLARVIVRLSLAYHYPAVKIDTDFSRRVISRYLDILDPGHFYFTRQDTKAIHSAFDDQLGKDLRTGNLTPAFAIDKFFLHRKMQLFLLALRLLAQKPDLDSSAHYRIDRGEVPRPQHSSALELLWKKRVDDEILDRLLRGERLKEALAVLRIRYRNPNPANHVFGQFMNAFLTAMDPHSRYLSAQEAGDRIGGTDTRNFVAGARMVNRNGYVTVVSLPSPGNTSIPGHLMNGERILGLRMKPPGENGSPFGLEHRPGHQDHQTVGGHAGTPACPTPGDRPACNALNGCACLLQPHGPTHKEPQRLSNSRGKGP